MNEPSPRQTLAVLLGASSFRRAPKLAQGRAFYNSAKDFHEYLLSSDGLNLPRDNVIWLFDESTSPSDQLRDVGDFLERRTAELENGGTPPQDLIAYYVGHGLFWGPEQAYCLAIRATDERSEGLTSIRASDLGSIIKAHARFLRKFLILDCCFSASAYKEFQSGPLQASQIKLLDELPQRGTTLLCSASAHDVSIAPEGLSRTMFSDSLCRALSQGHPLLGSRLSLSELNALVKEDLKKAYPNSWVRPEVGSPDQREGDVANVYLFPNAAFAAKKTEQARLEAEAERTQQAEAERTQVADEAAQLAEEQRKADEAIRVAEEKRKADEAARLAEEQRKPAAPPQPEPLVGSPGAATEAKLRADQEEREKSAEDNRLRGKAATEAKLPADREEREKTEAQRVEDERRQQEEEAKRVAEVERGRKTAAQAERQRLERDAAAEREAEERRKRKEDERRRAEEERQHQEAEAKREAEQEQTFAAAKRADTIGAIDEFLNIHPESRYTAEARTLTTELMARDEACQAAMASDDPAVLKRFLRAYPNGAPAGQVRSRLRSLEPQTALGPRIVIGAVLLFFLSAVAAFLYDRPRQQAQQQEPQAAERCAAARQIGNKFADFTIVTDTSMSPRESIYLGTTKDPLEAANKCAATCRQTTGCKAFDSSLWSSNTSTTSLCYMSDRTDHTTPSGACYYWFKRK
jgi:Caspase domain